MIEASVVRPITAITASGPSPSPCCSSSWTALGISAITAISATAPNTAFGLLRPRLIACRNQLQPRPGDTTRVVIPVSPA